MPRVCVRMEHVSIYLNLGVITFVIWRQREKNLLSTLKVWSFVTNELIVFLEGIFTIGAEKS